MPVINRHVIKCHQTVQVINYLRDQLPGE